ncbi:hemolysin family protein [Mycolicibacterium sp. 050158]|uniref:hemolysin family protein n=1 Tax=Mycolicibacterium sp. 050158 TaxID=3090602 RepID=UPI00299EACBF|nr:hemolysin family protein [Mycolicibacterium sp. 050158]MDX1891863.1 hemolysin family protein [Mycolicibacterium sp. 050158]
MTEPLVVTAVTIALIAASAFFVAVEFALIAARRHRLEDAAPRSRSARAALRSASELSVLLAGSQLGITVCTLLLGAVTKPAVDAWLTPLFGGWGALPWLADVLGFVGALFAVTFLHLVIGEMAPKSWAIAHPERSAIVLAIPMRGFMFLTRPLIAGLNHVANWCLRRAGVEPVDQVASAQNAEALRHLVEHSATKGTLDEYHRDRFSRALELYSLEVGDIVDVGTDPATVPAQADRAQVQTLAHRTGHSRLIVRENGCAVGVVHVRDTLTTDATAADLVRPALVVDAHTPVHVALSLMRDARSHVAIVTGDGDRELGLVTLNDVLARLLPTSAR